MDKVEVLPVLLRAALAEYEARLGRVLSALCTVILPTALRVLPVERGVDLARSGGYFCCPFVEGVCLSLKTPLVLWDFKGCELGS